MMDIEYNLIFGLELELEVYNGCVIHIYLYHTCMGIHAPDNQILVL